MSAPRTQRDDIGQLKTDVEVIKLDQKYIKQSVDDVKNTLKNMAYVKQSDFFEFRKKTEDDILALQKLNSENALGAYFSNLLSSKALTLVAGAIIAAAIYFIAKGGVK